MRVIDTKTAVGGIRILVGEALKHKDEPLDKVEKAVLELIPRIRVIAIPETLEYLHRGGRLSRAAFTVGSVLHLKPLITLDSSDGRVKVLAKALGIPVLSLTGEKESRLSKLGDVTVRVPSSETYRVQEYHLPVYHYLCAEVEAAFFKE